MLRRPGHTEAAVDLARLAGLRPAGVLCEIVNDDGTMMRLPELRDVRRRARPGADLDRRPDRATGAAPRRRSSGSPRPGCRPRTATFTAVGYRSPLDGAEHVALVYGDIGDGEDVLVRVHSECLTGDVFGSLRCDCGPQLRRGAGRGRRGGPRRGALPPRARGPRHRPAAQAAGLPAAGRAARDTVDANLDLGLPADARDYGTGAQILRRPRRRARCGCSPTTRPSAPGSRATASSVVGRVPLPVAPDPENLRYLRTKRDRMGHLLDDLEPATERPRTAGPRRDGAAHERLRRAGRRAGRRRRADASASSRRSWHARDDRRPARPGAARPPRRAASTTPTVRPGAGRVRAAGRRPGAGPRGYDAVVALGVVIRGGTRTSSTSATSVTDGLTRVALDTGDAGRLRRAHLRHRGAGPRPGRAARLARGQGLRGGARRAGHRAHPARLRALTRRDRAPRHRRRLRDAMPMKTFEELFAELPAKAAAGDPRLGHGRRARRRACTRSARRSSRRPPRSWMAAEHEGAERAAEEISQLLYHAAGADARHAASTLDDVYRHL